MCLATIMRVLGPRQVARSHGKIDDSAGNMSLNSTGLGTSNLWTHDGGTYGLNQLVSLPVVLQGTYDPEPWFALIDYIDGAND